MRRLMPGLCAVALVLSLAPAAAAVSAPSNKDQAAQRSAVATTKIKNETTRKKKHAAPRRWRGYGFLPGYRPPEVVERERLEHYWSSRPRYYGPAWPGFYRGRWNGGGFGPCYTQTPIGPVWNCGK